jgi:FkbM family methyltransferase
MRKPFWKRKILQLGKKFGFQLVDTNIPAELFPSILSFRSPSENKAGNIEKKFLSTVINHLPQSKGQLCQDLLVLFLLNFKKNGFFVEFGATDGATFSNTYLLETQYGWHGILAEPAKNWHQSLNKNRQCIVDSRCVWEKSGEELKFFEANDGELSTIASFKDSDAHTHSRKTGEEYGVHTISLGDLLAEHNAPKQIDYLSVDTEGSEFRILNALDFSKYQFQVITVEHNYTETRDKVHKLLTKNGYIRILEGFSQWDDWYIQNRTSQPFNPAD